MIRPPLIVLLLLGLSRSSLADDQPVPASKRRVFVLHSGIHTLLSHPDKNSAAVQLQEGLAKRGVAERDLIVLDNPFPEASWRDLFAWDGLTMYLDGMVPGSRVSIEAYLRLHKALAARGVGKKDEVVWIGHSAGGQIGLTMAQLAMRLGDFPQLSKIAVPYHFDMVILLGTPLADNPLPAQVKLRSYYSPQDWTVRLAAQYGPFALLTAGVRLSLRSVPAETGPMSLVRYFPDIHHHNWNVDDRVLDRILAEFRSDYCPWWLTPPPVPNTSLSLAQLLAQALEEQVHFSVEDLPARR